MINTKAFTTPISKSGIKSGRSILREASIARSTLIIEWDFACMNAHSHICMHTHIYIIHMCMYQKNQRSRKCVAVYKKNKYIIWVRAREASKDFFGKVFQTKWVTLIFI